MHLYVGFFSVVVICIDNSEWLGKDFLCCQYSVSGSPWLGTVRRFCKIARKIVDLLECISNFCNVGDTVSDHFFEFIFKVFADDKYDLVESCLQCIMDGIVHNDLALRAYRCKLLDSFSKTAADTGCHDHQCCLFHFRILLIYYNFLNSVAVISAYSCSFSFVSFTAWSAAIRLSMISSRSPLRIFSRR